MPGVDDDAVTRLAAATAVVGEPVAVTGWSAAFLFGLVRSAPTTIEVTVPFGRHPARDGLRIRRTRSWPADGVRLVRGVPVVAWSWMLADLAGEATFERLLGWSFDGLNRRELDLADLNGELERRGRFPGRANLRRVRDALAPDGSESGFEYYARQRMHRGGLRPDAEQVTVPLSSGPRRIDIPWSRYRVGVECQSVLHHAGGEALERDAGRRNEFVADGSWRILELTWRTMELRWDRFFGQLTTVLQRRGWRP